MDVSVYGIRDLDGKFSKMISVVEACQNAKVDYPPEVFNYFDDYGHPDEGVEYFKREMEQVDISDLLEEIEDEYSDVWDIDIKKLSPEIKKIRIVASY